MNPGDGLSQPSDSFYLLIAGIALFIVLFAIRGAKRKPTPPPDSRPDYLPCSVCGKKNGPLWEGRCERCENGRTP